MSIARCCPYSDFKETCKYEKRWYYPRFDKCPTCKIPMLQCQYYGGGIYWICGKCGCKVESTGL